GIGSCDQAAGRVVTAGGRVSQGVPRHGAVSAGIVLVLGAVAPLINLGGDLPGGVVFRLVKGAVGIGGFHSPGARVVLVLGPPPERVGRGCLSSFRVVLGCRSWIVGVVVRRIVGIDRFNELILIVVNVLGAAAQRVNGGRRLSGRIVLGARDAAPGVGESGEPPLGVVGARRCDRAHRAVRRRQRAG